MKPLELPAEILTLLARCSERLGRVALAVRRLPNVTAVSHRLEFRDYRSGALLEGYVDAELSTDTARTLWLELNWSEEIWTLESAILAVGLDGRQDVLQELPTEKIATLQQLELKLMKVIERLEEASETFAAE